MRIGARLSTAAARPNDIRDISARSFDMLAAAEDSRAPLNNSLRLSLRLWLYRRRVKSAHEPPTDDGVLFWSRAGSRVSLHGEVDHSRLRGHGRCAQSRRWSRRVDRGRRA